LPDLSALLQYCNSSLEFFYIVARSTSELSASKLLSSVLTSIPNMSFRNLNILSLRAELLEPLNMAEPVFQHIATLPNLRNLNLLVDSVFSHSCTASPSDCRCGLMKLLDRKSSGLEPLDILTLLSYSRTSPSL
jgi:hypothetical protein